MKITIYELLGLIKDGKAPKKIKKTDSNTIYFYNKEHYSLEKIYQTEDEYEWLSKANFNLNEEIEIIEEVEDKEYEDIEEIENNHNFYSYSEYEARKHEIDKITYILRGINEATDMAVKNANKINALIRNQKYILEQLNKEGK